MLKMKLKSNQLQPASKFDEFLRVVAKTREYLKGQQFYYLSNQPISTIDLPHYETKKFLSNSDQK